MKSVIRILILLFLICPKSKATRLDDFNTYFKLIPRPQMIELIAGKGLWYTELRGVYLQNTDERPVMSGILANLPKVSAQFQGTLSLVIRDELAIPSPEGYTLEIRDKQAIIQGRNQSGLFYGIQTLSQLLEDAQDQQIEIPACRITDYPEIAYRAIHLDLKHHLDACYYYYDLIDRLASIKVNAIIIEFEDKLRYRKASTVGAEHAVSVEEFAALSKYAKARFIEISPLIQGLGHASYILKHDEYKNLRDDPASDWAFDPLNPATYDLQFSLYEDAIAATPFGKYLHVGGDEVGDLGKSALSIMSGMNPFELQMYWLKKVTDFALEHNRIPIFWDDMVFKLSGLYQTTYDPELSEQKVNQLWTKNKAILEKGITLFPRNCVYMRWNYDNPRLSGNLMAIDWYKSHNLNAMAATSAQEIWPMLPRNNSNFQSIKDFCQITAEKKLTGILCTVWDDCSAHFETVWRGLYDFAFFAWNYKETPIESVHAAFRHRFYAPGMENDSLEIQDLLEKAMPFWETALLQEGDRENYHKTFKLIDLPDPDKSGEWVVRYKEKLIGARKAVLQYSKIKSRIEKSMELARRNRYALAVLNQINELHIYPSNLLLLLEKYDNASAKEKENAENLIKKYVNGFEGLRKRFEEVYSETRILGNPKGYQLDSNFHEHLANGTNNSDWMYMYELPMNRKITEWHSQ